MLNKKPGEPTSAGATGQAAAPRPTEQQRVTYRYVDRPECMETFADSVLGVFYDGQSLRIEFGISRLDDKKPDVPLSGRRYPVCRLVLPPGAAIDLINRMQQVAAALTQAGLVKAAQVPAEAQKPSTVS